VIAGVIGVTVPASRITAIRDSHITALPEPLVTAIQNGHVVVATPEIR
jgi:hypothetical protein